MAGKYERFRNFSYEIPKYLLPLSNRNILYYVLKNFDVKKNFDKVLLVANERDVRFLSQIQSILNEFDSNGELIFIPDTPGQSITALKGLEHLHQQNINDSVVIHNIDTILMNRDFSLFKDKLKKYDSHCQSVGTSETIVKLNLSLIVHWNVWIDCKIIALCDILTNQELTFNYNENETNMAFPFIDFETNKRVFGKKL